MAECYNEIPSLRRGDTILYFTFGIPWQNPEEPDRLGKICEYNYQEEVTMRGSVAQNRSLFQGDPLIHVRKFLYFPIITRKRLTAKE